MNFAWGSSLGRSWRRHGATALVAVSAWTAGRGVGVAGPLEWQEDAPAGAPVRLLSAEAAAPRTEARSEDAQAGLARWPLVFEKADECAPGDADFVARGPGYLVFVGPGGALLGLRPGAGSGAGHPRGDGNPADDSASGEPRRGYGLVGVRLDGARLDARATEELPQEGRVHRLKGRDPTRWQTNLRAVGRVRYHGVYPGIDVAYYGKGRELEYDFIVAPGASAEAARLRFEGVQGCEVDAAGQLRLATASGDLIQRRPVAYQLGPRGRERVKVAYRKNADGTVGFSLGEHDPRRELVIDPVLSYATYVGGTGFDRVWDLVVDGNGAAYVAGETESPDFSRLRIVSTNAFRTNYQGGLANVAGDAFVAKLAPDGAAFEWLTYLGGSDMDVALALALAAGGEVVVGGFTTSTNFPVTPGAFQPAVTGETNRHTLRKPLEGFVARLTADGSGLVAATLIGGTLEDQVIDLAMLPFDRIAAVGMTSSTNFPAAVGGAGSVASSGGSDAFVVIFSPDLATLQQARLLGGSGRDSIEGVAVDPAAGLLHVVGITTSTNLPVASAAHPAWLGGTDAFAAGLRATDLTAAYTTYLGGGFEDYAYRATLGLGGTVWLVGATTSTNLPIVGGIQTTNAGLSDGFVMQLSGDGQTVMFSTYLGGASSDSLWDVAEAGAGAVQVAGQTWSATVTGLSTNSLQSTNAGQSDVLLARLNPGAGTLETTLFGGAGEERAHTVGVDPAGNVYVAGQVRNGAFRANTNTVVQTAFGGGESDGFVMKVARLPSLAIVPGAAGLHVSWAAPNPGFILESSTAGAGDGWETEAVSTPVEHGRHVHRPSGSGTNRLFRLRWPR